MPLFSLFHARIMHQSKFGGNLIFILVNMTMQTDELVITLYGESIIAEGNKTVFCNLLGL